MYTYLKNLIGKHKKFVYYCIIGGIGASLDLIFYILFVRYLHIEPTLASFLSVSLGICNNFILNMHFNFKLKDKKIRRFIQFYTIGMFGAILSAALIFILFNLLGLNFIIAKLLTIIPIVVLQFIFNKSVSFKDS